MIDSSPSTSLAARMAAVRAEADKRLPPGVHPVHVAVAERLGRMSFPDALGPGDGAPDFELPSASGMPVRLSDALGHGPVVLIFYRGVWCPYCNTHLRAYQELIPALEGAGARLIAISPQTPDNSAKTRDLNDLGYDVLSDTDNRVAEQYGIAFDVDDEARQEAMEPRGVDLPRFNGAAAWRLPVPATFVISADGRIITSHVDGDFRSRLEPTAVLEALGITTPAHLSADAAADGRRSLDISFEVRGMDPETGAAPPHASA